MVLINCVGEKVVSIYSPINVVVLYSFLNLVYWLEFFFGDFIPKEIRRKLAVFFLILCVPLCIIGLGLLDRNDDSAGLVGIIFIIMAFLFLELGIGLLHNNMSQYGVIKGLFLLSNNSEDLADKQKTQKIYCPKCSQLLNVPFEYSGIVSCPPCQEMINLKDGLIITDESDENTLIEKSEVQNDVIDLVTDGLIFDNKVIHGNNISTLLDDIINNDIRIDRSKLSVGFSIFGVITGLISIFYFFSALSGEYFDFSRLFSSCCIFVPISIFFTRLGFSMSKSPPDVVLSADSEYNEDNQDNSSMVKTFQSMAQYFSLGLLSVVIIICFLIFIFISYIIYLMLEDSGFFL